MISKEQYTTITHFPNTAFDVVALATSLGGLNALSQILSALPLDFPAAITIVQHLSPNHPSHIAEILSFRTVLPVKQAEEGDKLYPGKIYIAPPNYHLLVNRDGTLSLSQTERVRFVRPAATNMFESLAVSFEERVIAVVLTGKDGDGATGVQAVKEMGGIVIAQDEASCESFSMPKAAIDTGCVDFVLHLKDIASALMRLVAQKPFRNYE